MKTLQVKVLSTIQMILRSIYELIKPREGTVIDVSKYEYQEQTN